jgi:pimeloyl-ACP methyl ester carboxylesterase
MASAVLERSPERFALAGFSLGSQVALEIMRTGKSHVERLALLSATHGGLLPPVRTRFTTRLRPSSREALAATWKRFIPRTLLLPAPRILF